MEKLNLIALDEAVVKQSVRERDGNGYLNVAVSRLTRDQVAPYYGREIPHWQELKLEPERIYYGWRNPEELQKALDTFNGKPLLIQHKFDSADHPNTELRVGTVGTSAQWEAPYITNALSIWDDKAIAAIEDGTLRDLSCGYRYTPDFHSGETPEGITYDFVMRDIACNHVALVQNGRADGCYVEDSLPKGMTMDNDKTSGGACDDFLAFARQVIDKAGTGLSPDAIEALAKAFADAYGQYQKDPGADAPAPAAAPAADEDAPAQDKDQLPAAPDDEPGAADDDAGAQDDEPGAADDDAGAQDDDADGAKDDDAPGAQDAALVRKSVAVAKREIRALFKAAADVKGAVGAVDPMAYDSADAVYMDALKQMHYSRKVKASEAKAVFFALQSVKGKSDSPKGAMDSGITQKAGNSFLDKKLNR